MDIDLISPLSIDECEKRLDAALVQYSVQLPLWNWPPRKMAGSRSGFGFTLDPRAFQFRVAGPHGSSPRLTKVPFIGLLSAFDGATRIHGSFDTSELELNRTKGTFALLVITIVVCIMTGIGLSQDISQTFHSGEAISLIGICVILLVLSIYYWSKRGTRPKPPYMKKVKKFLELTLDAKEA
jgi:hypothetical protein